MSESRYFRQTVRATTASWCMAVPHDLQNCERDTLEIDARCENRDDTEGYSNSSPVTQSNICKDNV